VVVYLEFARHSQNDWTGTGFVKELASQEFPWQSCTLKIMVEKEWNKGNYEQT
jgi:hypothetical protein